jgi:hypothetical protein
MSKKASADEAIGDLNKAKKTIERVRGRRGENFSD